MCQASGRRFSRVLSYLAITSPRCNLFHAIPPHPIPFISSHLISYCPVRSLAVPSRPIPSQFRPLPSSPVKSHQVSPCHVPSDPIPISSRPVPSHTSHPVPTYTIHPVPPHAIPSRPAPHQTIHPVPSRPISSHSVPSPIRWPLIHPGSLAP